MAEEVAGRRLRESDGSEDVTYNATHITVRRCGRTLHFEQPTAGQRYWAMLFLSGWDTMEELRASRWRMLWLFVVAGFVENLVNCLAEVMKVVTPPSPQMQGYANVDMKEAMKQLPAPLRAVCGLFTDSLQKFASLQNQLAIMSLFFVYWHNHAYVVSFIPGKAYIFIFGSYFLVFAFGCVQACGERAMGVFGCLACCWFLFLIPCVIFPMFFGYGWYSANFLWNTALADAVSEEMTYGMIDIKTAGDYLEREKVLEAEWAGDMECVRSAAEWLFGAHALEVATNFVLTLAESFIS